jgi:hypothetical protein
VLSVNVPKIHGIGCTCWSCDMGLVRLVGREKLNADVVGAREVGKFRMMGCWRDRVTVQTGNPSSGFCGM